MAGVSKQAVANWRVRASDFPEPVTELASGPIFLRANIRAWLRRNKRSGPPMTHVISTINLKGGVRQTTTTVALAETFSALLGTRVIVNDLDPHPNAHNRKRVVSAQSVTKRVRAGGPIPNKK